MQPLQDHKQQRQVLNWGLAVAFVLRVGLLFTATWVIQFWQFELVGALYLFWLAGKHFWQQLRSTDALTEPTLCPATPSFWQIIPLIALTDLAFSLDSVTTAVAFSNQLWLVLTGCIIGIVTLRFLAGCFVRWLEAFTYLQDAAYLTVLGVAWCLLCKAVQPDLVPPDWMVLTMVGALFVWGFSKRVDEPAGKTPATLPKPIAIYPLD